MLHLILAATLAAADGPPAECAVDEVAITGAVARETGPASEPHPSLYAFDGPAPPSAYGEPVRTGVIAVQAPPTTYSDVKVRCFYARRAEALRDGGSITRVPRGSACRVKVTGEGLKPVRATVVAEAPDDVACVRIRRKP